MAQRMPSPLDDPRSALDYYPTPPWATRALLHFVIPGGATNLHGMSCWEPACGCGHMAVVLKEFFGRVHASDVYPHGHGAVGSFVGASDASNPALLLDDVATCPFQPDWIITNPPFTLATAFVRRALTLARQGVAMLVRTQWLESDERFQLFMEFEPWTVAVFSERVPMIKGRWDPDASSATSYSWVVWIKTNGAFMPSRGNFPCFQAMIIPPGCRQSLTMPDDIARFAQEAA